MIGNHKNHVDKMQDKMLRERSIRKVAPVHYQFVSFTKKVGIKDSVINFKELNASILYSHFKVEGINIQK